MKLLYTSLALMLTLNSAAIAEEAMKEVKEVTETKVEQVEVKKDGEVNEHKHKAMHHHHKKHHEAAKKVEADDSVREPLSLIQEKAEMEKAEVAKKSEAMEEAK